METHLDIGSEVDVCVKGDSIVISPIKRRRYQLKDLIDAITPENAHPEFETGKSVGREEW